MFTAVAEWPLHLEAQGTQADGHSGAASPNLL